LIYPPNISTSVGAVPWNHTTFNSDLLTIFKIVEPQNFKLVPNQRTSVSGFWKPLKEPTVFHENKDIVLSIKEPSIKLPVHLQFHIRNRCLDFWDPQSYIRTGSLIFENCNYLSLKKHPENHWLLSVPFLITNRHWFTSTRFRFVHNWVIHQKPVLILLSITVIYQNRLFDFWEP
jgi:hypothetical protein